MKIKAIGNVALIEDKGIIINSTGDALDVMSDAVHLYSCGGIVLNRANFAPAYFDLSSGLLGEMLQKYTNYTFKVAISGSFDDIAGKSLKAFMLESNRRGDQVLFVEDEAEAIKRLAEIVTLS